VNETRRLTGSLARVSLRAEAWGEPEIEAVHARGNCYVSLHRGEGWGYPLLDAVTRGKLVVATAFAGPLDYLPPDTARLVPFTLAPVRQPYVYYGPQMRWAEPGIAEASRAMREVHTDRLALTARAAAAAATVCDAYSLERVGATARIRLMDLLRSRKGRRWRAIQLKERPDVVAPTTPIDGEWYDQDYFEYGLKSNWTGSYDWNNFSGLFRETAAYLTELFPMPHRFSTPAVRRDSSSAVCARPAKSAGASITAPGRSITPIVPRRHFSRAPPLTRCRSTVKSMCSSPST